MKRFLAVILVLMLSLFALVSCGEESDAPEGLQVAYTDSENGYIFYAPENWTLSNRGDISLAFISAINRTSVSFAKAKMPEGELDDYVKESISHIEGATLTLVGEKCNFGNEGEAYKYIYTYNYGTEKVDGEDKQIQYTTMQVLIKRSGDFYIFTYNALGAPDDAEGNYQMYLSYAQRCIDGFKFTEKSDSESEETVYEKDADGDILISNRELCGFSLYVPEEWKVVDSSAIVSAKISDGANLIISEARETGVDIFTYWKNRKAALELSVTDLVEIEVNKTNEKNEATGEFSDEVRLGDLAKNAVASYEYTYKHGGVEYHVYQILGWTRDHGYVFTYTATEAEYGEHLDEIMTVIEKLKF